MINYKGTPILGPDSSTRNTSEFFAIAGTVLFWLLFLIFSLVIKPHPKKQYKEVQIVLSSTPVVQKSEESPAPAEQAAAAPAASEPKVVETPKVETPAPKSEPVKKTVETPAPKKTETPKPKAQPQTQPKKEPAKTSTPAKNQSATEKEVVYLTDEEKYQLQLANKKNTNKVFDDSLFGDDDEPAESSTSDQVKTVQNNTPAFSGTAGTTAATKEDTKQISTPSKTDKQSQEVSNFAKEALNDVKNATFTGKAPNGIQSETKVQVENSGNGKVSMKMSNGHSRLLLDPKEPSIDIPEELYNLIDSSRTVKISFNVVPSGNVTDIRISPESSLHSSIRQEIIGQLLFWRFEPADYTATATFDYTIVKK